MKKYLVITFIVFLFLAVEIHAQEQMPLYDEEGDYPEVPRVSVWEAYTKYKAGKAIILHGGGEAYNRRHIVGAFNLEKYNNELLLRFPKRGIEIFTYCY